MDKLLAEGATLSPDFLLQDEEQYDKVATNLAAKLAAVPSANLASKDVLTVRKLKHPAYAFVLTNLQSLDPSVQTIAYLSIVAAAIQNANASGKNASGQFNRALLPDGELWPYMSDALLNFDPHQVRYVGSCVTEIVSALTAGAEESMNYIPAIQLLNNAILRIDPSSSTFSTTHYSYVQLCLRAGAFSDALNIIDRPIFHIPGGLDKQSEARSYKYRCSEESSANYLTVSSGLTHKITTKIFLEYQYMCALCYMAMGQYKKAILYLDLLLVAPTGNGVAHMIVVEAYRKWLLLNLLVSGSVPEHPRPVYAATVRTLRGVCKPYECLVDAFKFRDTSRLVAEINVGRDEWTGHNNLDLVREVLQAHRKFAVLKLGRIYASIPVSMVDAQVPTQPGTMPTLNYLQLLISEGELRGTLTPTADGSDFFLRFLPEAAGSRSEAEIEALLQNRARELQILIKHVHEADHRMQISKEYIDMLKKLKKNRDDDSKKGPGAIKSGLTADELDEDMMGDEL